VKGSIVSQLLNRGLGTKQAIDVRLLPARRAKSTRLRREDLELKLAALQQDYAELHTAIFEAAQVHRRLCAPRLVRFGDFELASEIFAVRQLPGDFFTVEETGSGVVLALGDVCGKGLAAGMWTPHLVGLLRTHTAADSEPEEITSGVNRDICRTSMHGATASLFLGKLDPITGLLSYCSAGHPPTFLLRANGALETLSEGGLLLGVLSDATYTRGFCHLRRGDMLVVYSDGITESRNPAGEEFGYQRLEAQMRQAQSGSADAALFSVLGAVQDFAGTQPLADDMSLAVIRRD
jgi:sigma-B regulation protein RsbU (phosphoserine phosphatase)